MRLPNLVTAVWMAMLLVVVVPGAIWVWASIRVAVTGSSAGPGSWMRAGFAPPGQPTPADDGADDEEEDEPVEEMAPVVDRAKAVGELVRSYLVGPDGREPHGANAWARYEAVLATVKKTAEDGRNRADNAERIRPQWRILTDPGQFADEKSSDKMREIARAGLLALEDAGVFTELSRLADEEVIIRPGPQGRLGWAMPALFAEARELTFACLARMRSAAEAGDHAARAEAYGQLLTIARIHAWQGLSIDWVLSAGTGSMALRELREEVVDRPPDAEDLRRLSVLTEERLTWPPMELVIEVERLAADDFLDGMYKADGTISLRAVRRLAEFGQLTDEQARRLAPRDEAKRTMAEFFEGMTELSRLKRFERAGGRFKPQSFIDGLDEGQWVARRMLPAMISTLAAHDDLEMQRAGTRLMLMVELFRAEHGSLPAILDELVPAYTLERPVDPFSEAGLCYRRLDKPDEDGRAYLLYSVGFDGEDNGGHWPPGEKRWPTVKEGKGLDFVLNRRKAPAGK